MRRLMIVIILLIFSANCFGLQKNVASQKWVVFAFDDTDNSAKTGDAAQITANLRIDGAAANAVDDTNPTELEDGYYIFDLTQAETNGDYILICPASSTSNIQVIGCPMATWTTPPYFPSFSIDSNGRIDLIKIAGTTQTANDNGADINAILIDTAAQDTAGEWDTLNATVVTAVGNIETDTAAQDTSTEIRTLLTGADTPVCKDSTPLTEAETEAEAVDALESFNLDHLLAVDTTVAADGDLEAYCVAGSIMAHALSIGADITTYKPSTDSPEAIRNRGDSAWITAASGLEVDLTKIHGSSITETTSGRFAANWDTFFDNADAATTKTLDDVGGASGLEVDVTKIHGSALSETSAGRIAGNFSTFWDNADAATAKVVDNVGAAASGGGSPLAITAGNLGDYKEDSTAYFIWRTVGKDGAAINPSTAGTVKVYKNNGTSEVTSPTGITDTRGFDSLTGIHLCSIDLSANSFYAIGQDYSVVLTGATIDTESVTSVIATFSIEHRFTQEFWDYEG